MTEATQTQNNNKGKWLLLLMVLLFGAPYIGSMLLFKLSPDMQLKTKNYGEMLKPTPIEGLVFQTQDRQSIDAGDLSGNWQLVMLASSDCTQACIDNLYKMQQVRRALGVSRHKLERNVLLLDESKLESFSDRLKQFKGTRLLRLGNTELEYFLAPTGLTAQSMQNGMVLIDPIGNIMMRFEADAESKGLLGDLEILLKSQFKTEAESQ